jgi:formamidopyrimidine-DNA glycosylase
MPELPEVETVVRDLRNAGLAGSTIVRASVSWSRTIAGCSPAAFRRAVKTRHILDVTRRGKYIVVSLSGAYHLLIHLRMTGQLHFSVPGERRGTHDHVALLLEDGRELRFRDPRKFGRWTLTRSPADVLGKLGPEPLDPAFSSGDFAERLAQHGRMLKPLLLDQTFLAGLGNIYVDEALFDAGLHPQTSSRSLDRATAGRLYRGIRKVLRRGVKASGTTLGTGSTNFYSVAGRRGRNQDGLRVFRRAGEPCPRCGETIERLIVAQRGTHICPSCQKPA